MFGLIAVIVIVGGIYFCCLGLIPFINHIKFKKYEEYIYEIIDSIKFDFKIEIKPAYTFYKGNSRFEAEIPKRIVRVGNEIEILDKTQIKFMLAHEISHIIYNYEYRYNHPLINKIINELFCDMNAFEISNLSKDEVKKFFDRYEEIFGKKTTEELIKWGYFSTNVRFFFVDKYSEQFTNKEIDVEKLAEDILLKYNKVRGELQELNLSEIISEIQKYI